MSTVTKTNGEIRDFVKTGYKYLTLEFPSAIEYEGETYPCAATLFYALKSTNPKIMRKIARLSPNKARQKVANLPYNEDYEKNKEFYLEKVLMLKFKNQVLANWLIATYPKNLVHVVTHMDDWIGVRQDTGKGENALGKALMKVRDILIEQKNASKK
jgi:predicted NAD-dependent protein-ADP-ribosyltransferase YbiA (DUF1768 family)